MVEKAKTSTAGESDKNRITGFPKAEKNQVIAHNGLTDEERDAATRLGYDLRDVRFITGRLGAELTVLGVRQRTVVLDAYQLRAALEELKAYAKEDSKVGGAGSGIEVGVGEDVSAFFAGMGTTTTGVTAEGGTPDFDPIDAREEQKPRRGRPIGAKDKKPRAARGSTLSPESDAALSAAVASLHEEEDTYE